MTIHDDRAVEQLERSAVGQVDSKDVLPNHEQTPAAMEQVKDTDEAPPITGSKQWKALYAAISNYAKEVKSSRDSNR